MIFCCAGCGEETCEGEGPTGAGMAMKHAGLQVKEFILLLVVLVSIVLQHLVSVTLNLMSVTPNLVSVTPNKLMFFKKTEQLYNNNPVASQRAGPHDNGENDMTQTGWPEIARNAPFA